LNEVNHVGIYFYYRAHDRLDALKQPATIDK
jgi:hypothetical protein